MLCNNAKNAPLVSMQCKHLQLPQLYVGSGELERLERYNLLVSAQHITVGKNIVWGMVQASAIQFAYLECFKHLPNTPQSVRISYATNKNADIRVGLEMLCCPQYGHLCRIFTYLMWAIVDYRLQHGWMKVLTVDYCRKNVDATVIDMVENIHTAQNTEDNNCRHFLKMRPCAYSMWSNKHVSDEDAKCGSMRRLCSIPICPLALRTNITTNIIDGVFKSWLLDFDLSKNRMLNKIYWNKHNF